MEAIQTFTIYINDLPDVVYNMTKLFAKKEEKRGGGEFYL
jgi:hypothetical protein